MGGGFDERGHMIQCLGDDVLRKLNDVFGIPGSPDYNKAQANNKFGTVENKPGNYSDLVKAYEAAGVDVKALGNWEAYLRLLGTAVSPAQGAQNIYDIAQVRYKALNANEGMSTIVHMPHHGGHVHTQPGSGNQPHVIDSPCPMPQPAPTK
jgi:hypothetical protein